MAFTGSLGPGQRARNEAQPLPEPDLKEVLLDLDATTPAYRRLTVCAA